MTHAYRFAALLSAVFAFAAIFCSTLMQFMFGSYSTMCRSQ